MIITVTGLSHKTAPVELREKLAVPEERIGEVLRALHERTPEGMIVSTCNRFEVVAHIETLEDAREELIEFIADERGLDRKEFEPFVYHYAGTEAIRHIFRVASSLDSMVLGEPQILGQLKQAFALAQHTQTVGFTLNSVMERAFAVAKKVRTETQIASSAVSVSSVAVELATKIFGKLDGKAALIVGAGKMGVQAINYMKSRGIQNIQVTNRTYQKAAELAAQIQARAVPFENLAQSIAESDIVISSTGSPSFIIGKELIQQAMARRKKRPIFFIDIAVPRDIDPLINQIDNVFLYDIDDLKHVVDANRKEREKEAEKAEQLVLREAEIFWSKLKSFDVAPTIREIQARVDALRQREIERSIKKLGTLSDEQRQAIEQLTASLTSKIVQTSFAELRHLANQPDGLEKIELIKKLFRL